MKIFGSIAVLIVLIAAINFMNLSTAQASRRSKEVGIKKLGGSTRGMLITQFLSESLILTFTSLILALVFIRVSLPYFNNLLETNLALKLFASWYRITVMLLFSSLIGFLSGSYPALFLSSFNPYEVLKGSVRNSMKNGKLRRILVVFQFAVSILLIVGTMVMYRQIRFMLNKDIGFSKEQILVINRVDALGTGVKSFKQTVKEIPGVIKIAVSNSVPGRGQPNRGYLMEGRKDESFLMNTNLIDYDYLETYGMNIVSGRSFNESFTTDKQACLLDESAVKNFNITDPEKTRIIEPDPSGQSYMPIIGIVKNFNYGVSS